MAEIFICIQDYKDQYGRERVRIGAKPSAEQILIKGNKSKEFTPAEDYALQMLESAMKMNDAAEKAEARDLGIILPNRRH